MKIKSSYIGTKAHRELIRRNKRDIARVKVIAARISRIVKEMRNEKKASTI